MIRSTWKFGKDDEVLSIRQTVGDVLDAYDEKSMHLILYNDDEPVSCGSLLFDNGAYKLSHLCVKPEFQRQYFGDMLIRVLIVKAFNMMAEKIRIIPTESSIPFFEKYGFKFEDETTMYVTAESLIMNSKCGHDCSSCINKCK